MNQFPQLGTLALLLAPHVPRRVRIVARASPAGLGAYSRMRTYFCANPKRLIGRSKNEALVAARCQDCRHLVNRFSEI